jgi:hypothetical protein
MLAEAMPTTFEWLVLSAIWFAWLWLPIVFLVIAVWRKRMTFVDDFVLRRRRKRGDRYRAEGVLTFHRRGRSC